MFGRVPVGLLSVAVLIFSSATAYADLKLVQKSSMDGELAKAGQARLKQLGALPRQELTTTYLKGNRFRIESGDQVRIFDGNRSYILNNLKKSYQVVPPAQESMPNPMLAMVDMKTTIEVQPRGKIKVIEGKRARNYLLEATVQINLKPGAAPRKGGDDPAFSKISKMVSQVEIWTADFPGVESSPALFSQALAALPGLGELPQKLRAIKGVGLETTMTQSVMGRTMTIRVQTVSLVERPLEDALFLPPRGWKQVPYQDGR